MPIDPETRAKAQQAYANASPKQPPKPDKNASLDPVECRSWFLLVTAWRKALKWTPGLDRALSVMLASITSTKSVGDQLWVRIISPPASGKSTLCEALSVNRKYVVAKSTIRGFHSGFKTDRDGEEDNSLLSQLYGKTLITKDGDTLLQAPNKSQILAEARDVYDGTSRTHYRNKMSKDYQGARLTWILCGTNSLRQLDSSELGERFLDCVIMESIDEDLEDEILWRVANRTESNMSLESDGKAETQYDPELAQAMQLTGGYVGWLRENAKGQLSQVTASEAALRECIALGKFVAFMRARPSERQGETAEREFASRLTSQMIRLAKCLAVVLNREAVDDEVLDRVRQVALDTARGRVLSLVRVLHKNGIKGLQARALAICTGEGEDSERGLLKFLRKIGVVESFAPQKRIGVSSSPRWRLTPRLVRLYNRIINEQENNDAESGESTNGDGEADA